MDIALTLVVNPDYDTSMEKVESTVADVLADTARQTRALSDHTAVDILFSHGDMTLLRETLSPILNGIGGLDWCLQSAENRKKKLILADMDSTMITVECIDELADFIGMKAKVSEITEAAMRGELDFEGALKERVALLKGLSTDKLEECYEDRINLMPGATALVRTMTANGAYAALVSGGFTFFTNRVADAIGFHMNHANVLEIEDGALTGQVVEPICGAATKMETLERLARERNLSKDEILAVGDGANDIPMIEAAGLGIAYHAKPKTRAAAHAAVTYGDLETLLYFQGYRADEIVR